MSEIAALITVIAVAAGAIWGAITVLDGSKLEECRRIHDVYECEMVAVPVVASIRGTE